MCPKTRDRALSFVKLCMHVDAGHRHHTRQEGWCCIARHLHAALREPGKLPSVAITCVGQSIAGSLVDGMVR